MTVCRRRTVTFDYGDPFAGERFWWSTKGDDLNTP